MTLDKLYLPVRRFSPPLKHRSKRNQRSFFPSGRQSHTTGTFIHESKVKGQHKRLAGFNNSKLNIVMKTNGRKRAAA